MLDHHQVEITAPPSADSTRQGGLPVPRVTLNLICVSREYKSKLKARRMIAQEDRRVRIAIVLRDNYAVRNCTRKLLHGIRANDRHAR